MDKCISLELVKMAGNIAHSTGNKHVRRATDFPQHAHRPQGRVDGGGEKSPVFTLLLEGIKLCNLLIHSFT